MQIEKINYERIIDSAKDFGAVAVKEMNSAIKNIDVDKIKNTELVQSAKKAVKEVDECPVMQASNEIIKTMDWKMLAALKLCVLSLGIGIGASLKKTWRNVVWVVCGVMFIITIIPLAIKCYKGFKDFFGF